MLSLRYNFSDTGKGHPNVIPMSPTLSPASDILPVDTLWSLSPAPSCPFPQMEPGEVTTVPDSELEVPASSGPSGDFEIREEEETTRPDLRNEVVAVVTPPAGPGPGRNVETGLMDNTIDSGNSAAQLPQKNILERKEVLIGEIWGQGFGGWGLGTQGDGLSQERGQARGGHWGNPHSPPKLLRGVSVSARKVLHNFLTPRWISREKKYGILVQRCSVVIVQLPVLLPNFQSQAGIPNNPPLGQCRAWHNPTSQNWLCWGVPRVSVPLPGMLCTISRKKKIWIFPGKPKLCRGDPATAQRLLPNFQSTKPNDSPQTLSAGSQAGAGGGTDGQGWH